VFLCLDPLGGVAFTIPCGTLGVFFMLYPSGSAQFCFLGVQMLVGVLDKVRIRKLLRLPFRLL
jgi:hypothetical protein